MQIKTGGTPVNSSGHKVYIDPLAIKHLFKAFKKDEDDWVKSNRIEHNSIPSDKEQIKTRKKIVDVCGQVCIYTC